MISLASQSSVLLSATEEEVSKHALGKERAAMVRAISKHGSLPRSAYFVSRRSTSQERVKTMSDQPMAHDVTSFHEAQIGTMITAQPSRSRQTLRFLLHFGEMVIAMLLGMGVFALVNSAILIPLGFVYLSSRVFPYSYAAAMAVAMTVPMVAWMRIRKHTWRMRMEMAGAMLVPTVLLIAVCWFAHLPSAVLLTGTHIIMVPAMLAVMLYRWRDYTCDSTACHGMRHAVASDDRSVPGFFERKKEKGETDARDIHTAIAGSSAGPGVRHGA
jgi:hypothetical protein